jgi:hypothetical protein
VGVPAQAVPDGVPEWTEQDALNALADHPDLARRLADGDPAAFAEYLELMPGVSVTSVKPA